MIDRSKIKKMYVWDTDITYKVKRYVIDTFKDGSCLIVSEESEWSFENGEKYMTLNYLHYKEITEDKYRPFKVEETSEEFLDYLFRRKNGIGQISKCTTVSSMSGGVYITGFWKGLDDLYEDWEMKKPVYSVNSDGTITKTYTDWMPVGVKK